VLEPTALAQRNLFGEAERIAARAASAGTRRQYAVIYRTFGFWLRDQLVQESPLFRRNREPLTLGRPPAVRGAGLEPSSWVRASRRLSILR